MASIYHGRNVTPPRLMGGYLRRYSVELDDRQQQLSAYITPSPLALVRHHGASPLYVIASTCLSFTRRAALLPALGGRRDVPAAGRAASRPVSLYHAAGKARAYATFPAACSSCHLLPSLERGQACGQAAARRSGLHAGASAAAGFRYCYHAQLLHPSFLPFGCGRACPLWASSRLRSRPVVCGRSWRVVRDKHLAARGWRDAARCYKHWPPLFVAAAITASACCCFACICWRLRHAPASSLLYRKRLPVSSPFPSVSISVFFSWWRRLWVEGRLLLLVVRRAACCSVQFCGADAGVALRCATALCALLAYLSISF